jgi:ferrochelatase
MSKVAVVLFNLGGPDSLKAVRPFLFNLFYDSSILPMPKPIRFLLASLISCARKSKAQAIYKQMGGKSPILEYTVEQAEALEKKLGGDDEHKVFVCMRHWHPMSDVVVKKVKAYAPDKIILLPLYPQFSTTTTGSAFADWDKAAAKEKLDAPVTKICCYAGDRNFVAAHVRVIKDMYWKASEGGKPRVLFSAHGLPEKTVLKGDPYQKQVEKTVASAVQVLAIDEIDYAICYQSRVGPVKWIGPSLHEEITRAAQDKVPVLVVPISFVSEHSETLVELDVEYRKIAESEGVPGYYRVPALGTDAFFIDALAELCRKAEKGEIPCASDAACPV